MKPFITYISLLITVFSINFDSKAAIITAITNGGTWAAPASWDLGRAPECGDTINVPFGININITTNVDLDDADPLCSAVRISIAGSIRFANGRKMRLAPGACFSVENGGLVRPSPVGMGSSENISIDGDILWRAADGNLSGPATMGCPILLPVTFISLNITQQELAFYLNWNVNEEENVSHYNVYLSENGYNWEKNVTVQALEKSSYETRLASTNDNQEFYIKLESVDVDGKAFILAIEAVKLDISSLSSLNEINIFPNPTVQNSNASIVFELNSTQEIMIQVIDFTGKVILEKVIISEKGQNLIPIETSLIQHGNYIVLLKTNDISLNQKLTIL
ncbi:MAG: T9SS type A sorting domain-containing protein [Flavobacteriia bacterium]|jgi:hypothetical protein